MLGQHSIASRLCTAFAVQPPAEIPIAIQRNTDSADDLLRHTIIGKLLPSQWITSKSAEDQTIHKAIQEINEKGTERHG